MISAEDFGIGKLTFLLVIGLMVSMAFATSTELSSCDFSNGTCDFVQLDDTVDTVDGMTANSDYGVDNTTYYMKMFNNNDTEDLTIAYITVNRGEAEYDTSFGFQATMNVFKESGSGYVKIYVKDVLSDVVVGTCLNYASSYQYDNQVTCKWHDNLNGTDFKLYIETNDLDGETTSDDVLISDFKLIYEDVYAVDYTSINQVLMGLMPMIVMFKLLGLVTKGA